MTEQMRAMYGLLERHLGLDTFGMLGDRLSDLGAEMDEVGVPADLAEVRRALETLREAADRFAVNVGLGG
jgi:hypothetical protein